MPPAMLVIGALVLGGASAMNIETHVSSGYTEGFMDHTIVETFSSLSEDAPEWCKNETNLSWSQRKQRMQQHATLEWAKQEIKKLRSTNESIPDWMEKIVNDDANRGKMKWASQECKRLKEQGKEVPGWMAELEAMNAKWANRWAACKTAELKSAGDEVPQWMIDNGRKGIMDYADEKAADLQAEIDALEEAKAKEEALVEAKGDVNIASQRMLATSKVTRVRSLDQQFHVLELALAELADNDNHHNAPAPRMKQSMHHVKEAYEQLGRILTHKLASLH